MIAIRSSYPDLFLTRVLGLYALKIRDIAIQIWRIKAKGIAEALFPLSLCSNDEHESAYFRADKAKTPVFRLVAAKFYTLKKAHRKMPWTKRQGATLRNSTEPRFPKDAR